VLDKPLGLSSTQALSRVRRLLNAEKAGHGGTLDPLASGILPIALGEATKTVSYAMDGAKTYRFTLRWGEQRTTDDAEGPVIATSAHRPAEADIRAALAGFVGTITQVPPQFSAIKLGGERAYDIARDGDVADIAPRQVRVDRFELTAMTDADHADFEVDCGKGTYMRSLARDLAEAVGTVGHVAALRRLRVGPFTLAQAISLDELAAMEQGAAVEKHLLAIETALDDIPALALTEAEAHRLRHGQSVALLTRQDRERLEALHAKVGEDGVILALCGTTPVALARVEGAEVRPVRVLNL
jgi:tRNA pseudouridine55 synthase